MWLIWYKKPWEDKFVKMSYSDVTCQLFAWLSSDFNLLYIKKSFVFNVNFILSSFISSLLYLRLHSFHELLEQIVSSFMNFLISISLNSYLFSLRVCQARIAFYWLCYRSKLADVNQIQSCLHFSLSNFIYHTILFISSSDKCNSYKFSKFPRWIIIIHFQSLFLFILFLFIATLSLFLYLFYDHKVRSRIRNKIPTMVVGILFFIYNLCYLFNGYWMQKTFWVTKAMRLRKI